jgi:hypothetical protein
VSEYLTLMGCFEGWVPDTFVSRKLMVSFVDMASSLEDNGSSG